MHNNVLTKRKKKEKKRKLFKIALLACKVHVKKRPTCVF